MKKILSFALAFAAIPMYAQEYSARLLDKKTQEPIPYATIVIGQDQGIISNDQGYFSFDLDQIKIPKDSIEISSLGYQTLKIERGMAMDSILYLAENTYELAQVFVESNPLGIEEILDRVIASVDKNHPNNYLESNFFYRQTLDTHIDRMDFDLKESTLEGLDKALMDSISDLIPKDASYYYEMVGTRNGDFDKGKMRIEKAAELYDKEKNLSMEGIAERMEQIFADNVKSNSYLKIKSGIFSTKVQVDSILDTNKDMEEAIEEVKEKSKSFQFYSFQSSINRLFDDLFYREDATLDIIEKDSRYKWKLDGYELIQNEMVYKINFQPKGSRDFAGVIYVNVEDFGIMRLDFHNVRNLRSFGLFGISYKENLYQGKIIFEKEDNYYPKYIEIKQGNQVGVKRPLKIIEKNKYVKGRRKQNEVYFKMNIQVAEQTKHELLILSNDNSDEEKYNSFEQNFNFEPKYLAKYDPEFWEDYLIIEPNEAIKSFVILDSD